VGQAEFNLAPDYFTKSNPKRLIRFGLLFLQFHDIKEGNVLEAFVMEEVAGDYDTAFG
jgi:hypothetical protein